MRKIVFSDNSRLKSASIAVGKDKKPLLHLCFDTAEWAAFARRILENTLSGQLEYEDDELGKIAEFDLNIVAPNEVLEIHGAHVRHGINALALKGFISEHAQSSILKLLAEQEVELVNVAQASITAAQCLKKNNPEVWAIFVRYPQAISGLAQIANKERYSSREEKSPEELRPPVPLVK